MSEKIIDLNAERGKRDEPDAEFIRRDEYGRPLYCYLLGYKMDGSTWGTEIWAYSFEDAEARVAAMRESLVVRGQAYSVTPA